MKFKTRFKMYLGWAVAFIEAVIGVLHEMPVFQFNLIKGGLKCLFCFIVVEKNVSEKSVSEKSVSEESVSEEIVSEKSDCAVLVTACKVFSYKM